jgi:hypothetical protein
MDAFMLMMRQMHHDPMNASMFYAEAYPEVERPWLWFNLFRRRDVHVRRACTLDSGEFNSDRLSCNNHNIASVYINGYTMFIAATDCVGKQSVAIRANDPASRYIHVQF